MIRNLADASIKERLDELVLSMVMEDGGLVEVGLSPEMATYLALILSES